MQFYKSIFIALQEIIQFVFFLNSSRLYRHFAKVIGRRAAVGRLQTSCTIRLLSGFANRATPEDALRRKLFVALVVKVKTSGGCKNLQQSSPAEYDCTNAEWLKKSQQICSFVRVTCVSNYEKTLTFTNSFCQRSVSFLSVQY